MGLSESSSAFRPGTVFSASHIGKTELSVLTDRSIPLQPENLSCFFHLVVWSPVIISEQAGGNRAGAVEREEVKRRLLGITEFGCLEVKSIYVYEILSGTASCKVPSLIWCRLLGKPRSCRSVSKQEADREIWIPRDARSPNLQSW